MAHNHMLCRRCRGQLDDKAKDESKLNKNAGKPNDNNHVDEPNAKSSHWFTNPYNVVLVGGMTVAGLCALPMIAGFGTSGIVASSAAAAWQSSIGNVVAGSTFATLQSMGATGTFVSGAYGGASAASLGVLGNLFQKNKDNSENKDEKDEDGSGNDEKAEDGSVQICASCGAIITTDDYASDVWQPARPELDNPPQ